jgi:hypothetical protein
MDLMSAQLAQLMIKTRLAEADERRLDHQIRTGKREERRRRRRLALDAWRQHRAQRRAGCRRRRLTAVAAAPALLPPSAEVAQLLDVAAHRVSELGTASEHALLQALSDVVAPTAPGAAAALVDERGTEISRLRAFGLVHAHVIEELGPRQHARLLDLVGGRGCEAASGRVA